MTLHSIKMNDAKPAAAPQEGFEDFWRAYPRKMAKADARKAWGQTATIRPPTADLVKAVIVACSQKNWVEAVVNCEHHWIPLPATWLRGERWEDVHEIELKDVVNGKMWYETASGIEHKGREFGLTPDDKEFIRSGWPGFKAAVMAKAGK